jgi:hypothetical protein
VIVFGHRASCWISRYIFEYGRRKIIIKMISKILVAMDGSDSSTRAYEYASFLAKKCDATLLIVNINDTFERISHNIRV